MTSLKEQLEEQGYVILRGLLSAEEARHYRTEIQKLSSVGDADFGNKRFECADGVSRNRQFWPLIDHPNLIPAVQELLGPAARYTQHSDLHAHRGGVGWHRDSACRSFGEGPDWDESQEPYQVMRVAIYLQTYAESHSSLGVIPGSHRYERLIGGREAPIWRRLIALREIATSKWGKLTRGERLPYEMRLCNFPDKLIRTSPRVGAFPWPPPQCPVWVRTEPGDCIIFNQRLYHSASPLVGPKYAVFLSYAAENKHARNHLGYYRHLRRDLNYGPLDPELAARLDRCGLLMEAPDPSEISPSAHFTVPAQALARNA
jgi:ectoine hydroxylase-related dioxygenase (phytanoyl-CoA dioxygenase family)